MTKINIDGITGSDLDAGMFQQSLVANAKSKLYAIRRTNAIDRVMVREMYIARLKIPEDIFTTITRLLQ